LIMTTPNSPHDYHLDLKLAQEHLFPAFNTLKDCLEMAGLMLSSIEINKDILQDEKYKYLFSVEEVNKLVNQGMPFRDAYKKVGRDIEAGQFTYSTDVQHTHEGSIGNLCTAEIRQQMEQVVKGFPFEKVNGALKGLLG